MSNTVLLIHGAFCGGWCFQDFIPVLAARGWMFDQRRTTAVETAVTGRRIAELYPRASFHEAAGRGHLLIMEEGAEALAESAVPTGWKRPARRFVRRYNAGLAALAARRSIEDTLNRGPLIEDPWACASRRFI